jgi:hypothetical protein
MIRSGQNGLSASGYSTSLLYPLSSARPSISTGTALPSPSDSTPKEFVNQDSQWDEDRRERDSLPAEADDVNALSLPLDRQASMEAPALDSAQQ